MTGRELYNRLIQFGDLDPQEDAVIGWIDEAQKKTSLEVPVVNTVTGVSISANSIIAVDNSIFKVVSAIDGSGNDYLLSNIKVVPDGLQLLEAVDFITIIYKGLSPDYTALDNELTIDASLHAPMLYYLISMYYDMEGEGDGEESGLAERYYQRWLYYRNLAISTLTGPDSDLDLGVRDPVSVTDVLPKSGRKSWGGEYYE